MQAATKWKRIALGQFGMQPGEGICTDMKAVRKDYFLDHDHSAYVDQWDWEKIIRAERPHPRVSDRHGSADLEGAPRRAQHALELFPQLYDPRYPTIPEELNFIHAEEILARYPDLPRKQRETAILQEHPAVFIYGIGWTLEDGYPHEMRAADYDDWVTETVSADGRPMHGLNGDILVWNPVTKRRHELTSMGVRVTKETLRAAARDDRATRLPRTAVSPGDRRTTRSRCRSAAASGSRAPTCTCSARRTSARSR